MDILHSTSALASPTFLRPPGLHEAIDGGAVQHEYPAWWTNSLQWKMAHL